MTEFLIIVAAIVALIVAVGVFIAIRDHRRRSADADQGALLHADQRARAGGDAGHGAAAGSAMTAAFNNGGGNV